MPRPLGLSNPATPVASRHPTVRDLAWAAGFIEGEGTFAWNGGTQHVAVCQVNKEPVSKLQELFGGSLRQHAARTKTNQPYWRWFVSGSRARGVMLTLFTFMSDKRKEQVRYALSQ